MRVDPQDGTCRSCGGILDITEVDDATMTVQCLSEECGDSYLVETDAFNDGGIKYWPLMVDEQWEERCDE
jgi:hypothetical protein